MDEKKTFFASLEPKSALLVGAVGGVLVIGTIGFLVLGAVMLKGGFTSTTEAKNDTTNTQIVAANNANANVNQTPTATNVPKTAKPKVELFVMSYCPYGLQMEKAYLPAWELLKNKADISLKFVDYAMHGLKEIEENTRQYCIQKEQPKTIISYLKCFTGKDDYRSCLTVAGVNVSKMNNCVDATNKTYGTIDKYNDQSTWLSGQYPLYPIYTDLNKTYGVQGSPTLVINGVQSEAGRTAEGVKQAICASFTNEPSECKTTLDNTSYTPGFGYTAGANTGSADCATPAQ